jgi:hypothetical protein
MMYKKIKLFNETNIHILRSENYDRRLASGQLTSGLGVLSQC